MILLRWDADDNACVAAQLSAENNRHFDALNQVAVVVVRAVVPAGATVEERLRALLAPVMVVTNYIIRQGAAGALAVASLWRGGLPRLEPGFPKWSSFHNREDLIIYFHPTTTVVLAMMDV